MIKGSRKQFIRLRKKSCTWTWHCINYRVIPCLLPSLNDLVWLIALVTWVSFCNSNAHWGAQPFHTGQAQNNAAFYIHCQAASYIFSLNVLASWHQLLLNSRFKSTTLLCKQILVCNPMSGWPWKCHQERILEIFRNFAKIFKLTLWNFTSLLQHLTVGLSKFDLRVKCKVLKRRTSPKWSDFPDGL